MILTVHDELVLEVPLDEREKVEPVVKSVMENVTQLRVPLGGRPRLRQDLGRHEVSAGPERPGWFNPIAAFLGDAYWAPGTTRVQAFTVGTEQEVDFLVAAFDLAPGARVLDAGCGPGRHALALARRGHRRRRRRPVARVRRARIGFGCSARRGRARAIRDRGPARARASTASSMRSSACARAGSACLGGGDDEGAVLERFARALRPGGRLAVSAFNAYFALRHLEAGDTFDAFSGVNHERATLRDAGGNEREFDLWTTCFTPRELILLARAAGLEVDAVHGVTPGRYAAEPPSIDLPEHLLLAHRN